jgi:hypothetical protein
MLGCSTFNNQAHAQAAAYVSCMPTLSGRRDDSASDTVVQPLKTVETASVRHNILCMLS